MLLSEFIADAVERLSSLYPEQEARNIVLILCEELLHTKSYTHIVEPQTEIPQDKEGQVLEALLRLEKAEPLQYVLSYGYFYGRRFALNSSCLIPRPETESLVEETVSRIRSLDKPASEVRVLDLCTGSGCIAWTLALECPGVRVTALDISPEALSMASSQSFPDVPELFVKPEFVLCDILGEIPASLASQQFDIIVSNPPYIMEKEKAAMRANVLDWEPSLALFVEDSDPLLFYRAVACWAMRLLACDGWGIVEINELLPLQTAQCMKEIGVDNCRIIKDLYGKDRFVSFFYPCKNR